MAAPTAWAAAARTLASAASFHAGSLDGGDGGVNPTASGPCSCSGVGGGWGRGSQTRRAAVRTVALSVLWRTSGPPVAPSSAAVATGGPAAPWRAHDRRLVGAGRQGPRAGAIVA